MTIAEVSTKKTKNRKKRDRKKGKGVKAKTKVVDEDVSDQGSEDGKPDGGDYSDVDFEGLDSYKPGGYHPVTVGEIYDGRFLVLKKLGWGHFSTVWLCRDLITDKLVALKVQKSASHFTDAAYDEINMLRYVYSQVELAKNEVELAFRREVLQYQYEATRSESDPPFDPDSITPEMLLSFDLPEGLEVPQYNPFVITFIGDFIHSGPNGDHMCMVFECLGDNILSLIKALNYRGIPVPIVRKFARQLCVALDFLHRKCGIIHTDLKPENVLLSRKLPPLPESIEDLEGSIIEEVPMTEDEIAESLQKEIIRIQRCGERPLVRGSNGKFRFSDIADLETGDETALSGLTGEARRKAKKKLKKKAGANGRNALGDSGFASPDAADIQHSFLGSLFSSLLSFNFTSSGTKLDSKVDNEEDNEESDLGDSELKSSSNVSIESIVLRTGTGTIISDNVANAKDALRSSVSSLKDGNVLSVSELSLSELNTNVPVANETSIALVVSPSYLRSVMRIFNGSAPSEAAAGSERFLGIKVVLNAISNAQFMGATDFNSAAVSAAVSATGGDIDAAEDAPDAGNGKKRRPKKKSKNSANQAAESVNQRALPVTVFIELAQSLLPGSTQSDAGEHPEHENLGEEILHSTAESVLSAVPFFTPNNLQDTTPLTSSIVSHFVDELDTDATQADMDAPTIFRVRLPSAFLFSALEVVEQLLPGVLFFAAPAQLLPALYPLHALSPSAVLSQHVDAHGVLVTRPKKEKEKEKEKEVESEEDESNRKEKENEDADSSEVTELASCPLLVGLAIDPLSGGANAVNFQIALRGLLAIQAVAVASVSNSVVATADASDKALLPSKSHLYFPLVTEADELRLFKLPSLRISPLLPESVISLIHSKHSSVSSIAKGSAASNVGPSDALQFRIRGIDVRLLLTASQSNFGLWFPASVPSNSAANVTPALAGPLPSTSESSELAPSSQTTSSDVIREVHKLFMSAVMRSARARAFHRLQPPRIKLTKTVRRPRELSEEELAAATARYESQMADWLAEVEEMDVYLADLGNSCWITKHFSDDIQTRQYRAPEVILGAEYNERADLWSLGCMVFEMLTGDFLFDSSEGKDGQYSREEDHLAQMLELLGDIDPRLAVSGSRSHEYFDAKGRLLHIQELRYWPPRSVLTQKYRFSDMDAALIELFLLKCLRLDPNKRASSLELIDSVWFTAPSRNEKTAVPGTGEVEEGEEEELSLDLLDALAAEENMEFFNAPLHPALQRFQEQADDENDVLDDEDDYEEDEDIVNRNNKLRSDLIMKLQQQTNQHDTDNDEFEDFHDQNDDDSDVVHLQQRFRNLSHQDHEVDDEREAEDEFTRGYSNLWETFNSTPADQKHEKFLELLQFKDTNSSDDETDDEATVNVDSTLEARLRVLLDYYDFMSPDVAEIIEKFNIDQLGHHDQSNAENDDLDESQSVDELNDSLKNNSIESKDEFRDAKDNEQPSGLWGLLGHISQIF